MNTYELIVDPLMRADRERPDLKITNTKASCFQLLKRALELAGPDWAFVGKTATMDGDGKFAPAGFVPLRVRLPRPDGQLQDVDIVAVSMDAAWHMPSNRQVKVLAFSTANEPGPWEHGPARLTPYDIDPDDYRWHNPPVAQTLLGSSPQQPAPSVPAPSRPTLPGREEMMNAGRWLDAFYRSPEGLQRDKGLSIDGAPDWEGVGAWLFDVYLMARVGGASEGEARAAVVREIQQTDEWKGKHR